MVQLKFNFNSTKVISASGKYYRLMLGAISSLTIVLSEGATPNWIIFSLCYQGVRCYLSMLLTLIKSQKEVKIFRSGLATFSAGCVQCWAIVSPRTHFRICKIKKS